MASAKSCPRIAVRRADYGVSVIEYAAVILLAGVILASAGLVVIRGEIARNVPPALCYLLSAGTEDCEGESGDGSDADGPGGGPSPSPTKEPCGGRSENKDDEKFKPALCETLYEKEWSKSEYSFWFIKISNEFAFIRQEFSDGSVRLTAVSTGSVSVDVEGGLNIFKSGDVELGGKLGGNLDMKFGDTFVFKDGKGADAQISKIKSHFQENNEEQSRLHSKTCLDNPGHPACKPSEPEELDIDPQITTKAIGGGGSASLNLGKLGDGKGKDKKDDKDKDKDKDKVDEGGGNSLNLNLLGGKGKLAGETIEEYNKTDPKNPKTSKTFTFTVDGEGGGGLLQGKGTKNVSLKVTRDKDGKLIGVTLSEAVESPDGAGFNVDFAGQAGPLSGSYGKTEREGRYDSRTAALDVTDDNRELVEDWLSGQGGGGSGDAVNEIGEPVDLDDDSTPWDRVKKEFYDHGKVSKVLYDTEYKSERAGWGVSFLGMDFGVAMEWGHESREAIEADYLGAPDGENPRDWVDFPECVYKDGGDDKHPPPPPPPPPGCPTKKD